VKLIANFISRWMAVIILLTAAGAMVFPEIGNVVSKSWISWLLGAVMLGMGLMLRLEDFRVVFTHPKEVLSGTLMQFAIMPFLG